MVNHAGGGSCNYGDSAAYAFNDDLDVVAAATPAFGAIAGGEWPIPDDLPPGDYALLAEVGKEFDDSAGFRHSSVVPSGDWASEYGLDGNVGQPSVVFRLPFSLAAPEAVSAGDSQAVAVTDATSYGDWTGATGDVHPIDDSIGTAPGSGVGRLAISDGPGGPGRVHAAISACAPVDCSQQQPPLPVAFDVDPAAARPTALTINLRQDSDGGAAVLGYELRFQNLAGRGPLPPLSPADFPRWAAGPYVAPGPPGQSVAVTLAGLTP